MRQEFSGKHVLIMGLGVNGGGAGAARFFARKGARVLVTDLKPKKDLKSSLQKLRKFKNIEYVLGKHRKKDFLSSDIIIQSPAVPEDSEYLKAARRKGITIDTDIGIFFDRCKATIIGVTGSKGKSTVAACIAHILKRKFRRVVLAGNIGRSPLDTLELIRPDTKVVLELSSWQLEGLALHKKSPHIAVVTNVLRDHLNRYAGFRRYAHAKSFIFSFQRSRDYLIIEESAKKILAGDIARVRSQVVTYGNGLYVPARVGEGDFLAGTHNKKNLEAVCIVSRLFGMKDSLIIRGLKSFGGLPGREEFIATVGGVSYYNDTTATMPDAVIAALHTIRPRGKDGRVVLIAGGSDKKLDFANLAREIVLQKAAIVLLPGDATEQLTSAIAKKNARWLIRKNANSMARAVKYAHEIAKRGDAVILSPGAASFGLFQNEFERGRQFIHEVKKLRER